MLNPFLLTGFGFLLFYFIFALLVNWGLRVTYRNTESGDAPNVPNAPTMTDPYLIACLRGGEKEALRVATVALIDRGLLNASGETLTTKNEDAIKLVNRPIEKAVLKRYSSPGEAGEIFADPDAQAACEAYKKVLTHNGLVADGGTYRKRMLPMFVALGALAGVTAIKIYVAFAQGRHNVGFLIVLTIIFAIAVLVAFGKGRTARGEAMMADLKQLFDRLKKRANTLASGGKTNEAALLAAVFGISALSASAFPFVKQLYPGKGASDSGSSCGSSGSSCSSSSCGGGGCGGGCGG